MKEKSISTDKWVEKYEKEFIKKHNDEGTNLELFHFTVDKLNILRIRILMNSGISSFNQSHKKFIDGINKEFEDYVEERLSEILTIKKSNKQSLTKKAEEER